MACDTCNDQRLPLSLLSPRFCLTPLPLHPLFVCFSNALTEDVNAFMASGQLSSPHSTRLARMLGAPPFHPHRLFACRLTPSCLLLCRSALLCCCPCVCPGANAVLTKPINRKKLADTLARYCPAPPPAAAAAANSSATTTPPTASAPPATSRSPQ